MRARLTTKVGLIVVKKFEITRRLLCSMLDLFALQRKVACMLGIGILLKGHLTCLPQKIALFLGGVLGGAGTEAGVTDCEALSFVAMKK